MLKKVRIDEIKSLIEEAYYEVLREQYVSEAEDEKPLDRKPSGKAPSPDSENVEDVEGLNTSDASVLEDATDEMLSKFPTLKAVLIRLMSEDYGEFVDSIDYISPRPTAFKINLTNQQNFILTWQGKGFQANVLGKNYYLSKINEFQQALDKLSILYREGPLQSQDGEGEYEPSDTGSGGSGGDFPGEEGSGDNEFSDADFEDGGESPEAGAETEAPPADLGDEKISFEDGADPKA